MSEQDNPLGGCGKHIKFLTCVANLKGRIKSRAICDRDGLCRKCAEKKNLELAAALMSLEQVVGRGLRLWNEFAEYVDRVEDAEIKEQP